MIFVGQVLWSLVEVANIHESKEQLNNALWIDDYITMDEIYEHLAASVKCSNWKWQPKSKKEQN